MLCVLHSICVYTQQQQQHLPSTYSSSGDFMASLIAPSDY